MKDYDLVLIGGGHSHAIALKKFGMNPIPGVQLTLITDVSHTPYSGMLPGYVAGLYTYDECHIDLRPLANFAGARMILDRVTGLDLEQQRVICAGHPAIAFDQLSINIGSTPALSTVPGAATHAIPVKPISQFLHRWDAIVAQVQQQPDRPLQIGVVGGGAGGVELALAVRSRLPSICEIHLFHSGTELLEERDRSMRQKIQRILPQRGIQLHLGETVCQVDADQVECKSGLKIPIDLLFWVTQASAADWIKASELETDDRGFICVNDYLQSRSHPNVFAAGDIAHLTHPRPKAGVFAVRAGKPLSENLRRWYHLSRTESLSAAPKPLQPFIPQKQFLILLGQGNQSAIASRGKFTVGPSRLLWNWKDGIDRKFMEQFVDLQPMMRAEPNIPHPSSLPQMHCAGCGSKVGSSVLERSLARLRTDFPNAFTREDILVGLDAPDDAAVWRLPSELLNGGVGSGVGGAAIAQTVDYFRALVEDPFVFGQIVANHCLSDLFAMGAVPQSVLAIATLPYAPDHKLEETLYHLLSGVLKALIPAGAVLVGGHSSTGSELAFGLTCNGWVQPEQLLSKRGMKPGDALILTKPLGTGTLFAADMQLRAKGRWVEGAIASMLQSNQSAATTLQQFNATACTDITGFGLLGHLVEMVRASAVGVELDLAAVPLLMGAVKTVAQGHLSSLHPQNWRAAQWVENIQRWIDYPQFLLLFDPQTSGGLLASVPAVVAAECVEMLRQGGDRHATIIGFVRSPENSVETVETIRVIASTHLQ